MRQFPDVGFAYLLAHAQAGRSGWVLRCRDLPPAVLNGLRKPSVGCRGPNHGLNERCIKTAAGKAWTAVQVMRVRERLGLVDR